MKRIGVSQFRQTFITLREPVEILKGVETIGTFYPAGSEKTLSAEMRPPRTTLESAPTPPLVVKAPPKADPDRPRAIEGASPQLSVHQILAKVNTKTK